MQANMRRTRHCAFFVSAVLESTEDASKEDIYQVLLNCLMIDAVTTVEKANGVYFKVNTPACFAADLRAKLSFAR